MSSSSSDNVFDMGSDDSLGSLNEIPMELDLTAAGPPLSDDDIDIKEFDSRFTRTMAVVKRFLPHVGLVALLIAYLLIGATIFHAIERPNELIQRESELRIIFGLRDDFQEHIWNITQDTENKISKEALDAINEEYFRQLVKQIFNSFRNQYINERHLLNTTKGDEYVWTYPNSIFFATTVITTIG
ncbi:hypothetical protein WR25_23875 [Diploscapter pachys]|uniref:Potassium channel domain-containing protein n=1 Tax=Diploscapter pachys TaxID=2018661 RepID=A0A2A2JYS1_9BILA|nr:hypothetical protein WR25_23875 [Diploscapter pachys]